MKTRIDSSQSVHKVTFMNTPIPIRSDKLDHPNTTHGFYTRKGGASNGIYSGLNVGLGSDDDRETVLENRHRVARSMGVNDENLVMVYQVHSADVAFVAKPWNMKDRPKLDAMVCCTPDIAIGVMTADCGPVLFQDAENGIIGAAHAGWKGATGGILENTVSAMETIGAERENITAVLGPTISQKHYEVGPEFVDNLVSLNTSNDQYLNPSTKPDHAMFDLPGYIVDRLTADGVAASWCGDCTYADEEQFFSYRRKTHRNEADYGRQVSVIKINP